MTNEIAKTADLHGLIEEYNRKIADIPVVIESFRNALQALKYASTTQGTYGELRISSEFPNEHEMTLSLRRSAWRTVYEKFNFKNLMTTEERKRFENSINREPPDFTLDALRGTFGDKIRNPRMAILKGLAEAFCSLDQSYKSHSKVKIGVKGLPKKVIFQQWGISDYDVINRIADTLNALRLVQNRGPVHSNDIRWNIRASEEEKNDRSGFLSNPDLDPKVRANTEKVIEGVSFKKFQKGTIHVIFDADTLKDINYALAEYYGDVLPDTEDEKGSQYRSKSTEVAIDLQFYRTPKDAARRLVNQICVTKDTKILEPSCGDGALISELLRAGANVQNIDGYEFDTGRVSKCITKGFRVCRANFLEVPPEERYDIVVMNPPFYGKHYLKHIEHAIKFLKPGGTLVSILPGSAWYDHGMLPESRACDVWRDLPVGSFAESGTNVPTGIWTFRK